MSITKSAKNKFERYLADQPHGKTYSDPRVQRASNLVRESDVVGRNARNLNALGANPQTVSKYLTLSQRILQRQRGYLVDTKSTRIESPFKNPDRPPPVKSEVGNLASQATNPKPGKPRLPKDTSSNKFLAKVKSFMRKSPVKSRIIGAGIAGAGSALLYKRNKTSK